jgi:hypothetical protein
MSDLFGYGADPLRQLDPDWLGLPPPALLSGVAPDWFINLPPPSVSIRVPPPPSPAELAARAEAAAAAEELADQERMLELIAEYLKALREWSREIIFYLGDHIIARATVRVFDRVPGSGNAEPAPPAPPQYVNAPVEPWVHEHWANLQRKPAPDSAQPVASPSGVSLTQPDLSSEPSVPAGGSGTGFSLFSLLGGSAEAAELPKSAPDANATGADPQSPAPSAPIPPTGWDRVLARAEAGAVNALAAGVDGLIAAVDTIGDLDTRLGHPLERAAGAVSVVTGVAEAVAGLGEAALGAVTVAGAVPGVAAAVNGLDNAWAGLKTIWTGEGQDTYTQQAIGAGVERLTGSKTAAAIAETTVGILGPKGIIGLGQATTRVGRKLLDQAAEQAAAEAAEAAAREAGEKASQVSASHTGEIITGGVGDAASHAASNRGLIFAPENLGDARNAAIRASRDFEAGTEGAVTDIVTQTRQVPALQFDNPNPKGASFVKFDGFSHLDDGTIELIDSKTRLVPYSTEDGPVITESVADGLRRQSAALVQNPGYTGMLEFPTQAAADEAEGVLEQLNIKNISVRVRQ